MKINDGNWLIRKGLQVMYPVHVHEVQQRGNELLVHAAPKDVSQRAYQLDTALFTLRLFAPRPGIIGVRMEHFQGGGPAKPAFTLYADTGSAAKVELGPEQATLSSGTLSVRIPRSGPWALDFFHGAQRLTGSGLRSGGQALEEATGRSHMFERLDLGVGENIYGLGERFTPFVRNGQVVDIWNQDGGTSSEQSYKNIPFYLSSRGYGVFVNTPRLVSFEVGSEKVAKVQFSTEGEALEYFVIDGPDPKDVLDRYTQLTGRPPLPPQWSFGLWLTTSFTTDYNEETVNHFIDGMAERGLPLHVFHFDCFWMKAFHWCDFEWNRENFPDPVGMLARLKARGLKICLWINPYIAQPSPLFQEGMARGYLLRRTDGSVWQWDRWQPGQALVDFSNPAACDWYADHLRRLIDMGVDCFKTDFGERIPTDVVYHDGSDPQAMHNYYCFVYNQLVYRVLQEKLGETEAVLFARAATVGSQQFPVHWGGDCSSSYESMAESLRGGLSLGLSGFGYWSHDIGGFENTAPADVYKRWCAFGLLSSHSRLHGSKSYRVPWLFDEEAVDVLRHFTQWKCRLMPYLWDAAVQARDHGTPMVRPLLLEFPQDLNTHSLDRQYLLGSQLLVAPVLRSDSEVDVYLPEGRWTHLFTGEVVDGGRWRHERHGMLSLPLYVRPGSLLALGARNDRPDYDYSDGLELHLFELADGQTSSVRVPDAQGAIALQMYVRREGTQLHLRWQGQLWSAVLVLRGLHALQAPPAGVRVEASVQGLRVHLPEDGQTLDLQLAAG
jgi:alpha-D-xyloside xylohydrolase